MDVAKKYDWMTSNARDLFIIAVRVAGFDEKELVTRLCKVKMRGERMNARTVGRVIGEMYDDEKAKSCGKYPETSNETVLDVIAGLVEGGNSDDAIATHCKRNYGMNESECALIIATLRATLKTD